MPLLKRGDLKKLGHFAHDIGSNMIHRGIPVGLNQYMLLKKHRQPHGTKVFDVRGRSFEVAYWVEDCIGATVVQSEGNFEFRLEPGVDLFSCDFPIATPIFLDWLRQSYL